MIRRHLAHKEQKIKIQRPKVAYYGEAHIGKSISFECAVLEDGRRGYVLKSLRTAIGMRKNIPVPAFERFCSEIAPNAMNILHKSGSRFEVIMPHGGLGVWVEAGVLTHLASGVIRSQIAGRLRANRQHLVEPCLAIQEALSEIGEVALIDEATGYQYRRAPDALQDLVSKLIKEKAADWERRFHPEFYMAICKMLGIPYGNKHRALPSIVGKITMDWIYEVIFPQEIIAEIKTRRKSEKLHQWLEDGGLNLLEKQRDAVMMVARVSTDYKDFDARCSVAFFKKNQQVKMTFPIAEAA